MEPRNFRLGLAIAVAAASGLLIAYGAQAQNGARARNGTNNAAEAVATPHTADGKPDLSGMWGGRGGGGGDDDDPNAAEADGVITARITSRRCAPNENPCDDQTNQTIDGEFTGRLSTNRPLYKPEYWDKVQDLDYNTNFKDPIFQCQPRGVPRMGAPTKIMQSGNEIVLFYGGSEFRDIPTDGRPHDPVRAQDITFYGDSVGHWDGETLVIDSVGFNDLTWLDKAGYFHSDLMHVIEKFHRDGNTLTYEVTVDDPQVLLQPWVLTPRVLRLNPDTKATLHETDPCRDYDSQYMTSRVRH